MGFSQEDLKSRLLTLLPFSSEEDWVIQPILGGRNNLAFCVTSREKKYFLKYYNQNHQDGNKKLSAEFDFLTYAALICKSRYVAKPVACDSEHGLAVYEHIEGSRFDSSFKITESEIKHTLQFIEEINRKQFLCEAQNMQLAAEACFTLKDHIRVLDNRMTALKAIEAHNDVEHEAKEIIDRQLIPLWEQEKKKIESSADFSSNFLLREEKIVSPSDFGFHNALYLENGDVKFVDFEYAGLDDPAKLVCDYFNQVEVPVPLKYFDFFSQSIAEMFDVSGNLVLRIKKLFLLYRIKWCCIILNYFASSERRKKEFVGKVTEVNQALQLQKAKKILGSFTEVEFMG